MKNVKITVLFFCIFSFLCVSLCFAEISVESNFRYRNWGFKNSRTGSDVDFDKINIEKIELSVSFPFIYDTLLITGYNYSYILESQIFMHLFFEKNNISIESGVSAGFFNEWPVDVIPGIFGKANISLGKMVLISLYGSTSFFIQPLVSLSTPDNQFDQNSLGTSSSFFIKDAILTLGYENENIAISSSSSSTKKNSRKTYELEISTDVKDFWINSITGVGADVSQFKEGSARHGILGMYLEETLLFKIKKVNLSTGLKTTLLYITFDDTESSSSPKTPSFSFAAGIHWPN